MEKIITEFVNCINNVSYARAGWDYRLSAEDRQREGRMEYDSLDRARIIWRKEINLRDALRTAFREASPLMTFDEIERE